MKIRLDTTADIYNSMFIDTDILNISCYDTPEICAYLDKIRSAKGLQPFFFAENQNDIDCESWYDVYVNINVKEKKIIRFYGMPHGSCYIPDNFEEYDLEFQADNTYEDIKAQFEKYVHESIEQFCTE